MKKNTLLGLLFILVLSNSISAQILLKEVSLSKQIEKSTLVLEGKVLSKKSYWDANHEKIYTVNTIEVHKVFKGDALPTIEIITQGGAVGFDAQVVYPSLKLNVDEIGVFTLYESNASLDIQEVSTKKRFESYGSLQGFYKYNMERDIAENRFSSKQGITSTFYNEIKSTTKVDYIQLTNFDVQSKVSVSSKASVALLPLTIAGFSPTSSTAGTKSIITINGSNFGLVKGKVGFTDANSAAGTNFVNALDSQVLTWTDTSITVEVPSEAGTGKIKITHSDGSTLASNTSLSISYAQSNIVSDNLNVGVDIAYPTQLVDDNGNGGYTWQMTSDFAAVPGAKEAFIRALNTWSCETQINWALDESNNVSSSTAQHKSASDGINVLAFDNSTSGIPGDDLPDTVLGKRTSYYSACYVTKNGVSSMQWYIKEFDIVFDDEAEWNFDTTSPSGTAFDFESVAVHELGHCRQLDHIVNTNNVMHYAIAKGETLRTLDNDNITVANMVQSRSTTSPVCSQPLMTNYSGSCALGVDEDELNEGIRIYPNPTKGSLFIRNDGLVNLEKVAIYDLSGRLISQQDISNTSRLKTVHLNSVSKGIYFVNIFSDKTFITKKIILE
jgi:hypothetical protein